MASRPTSGRARKADLAEYLRRYPVPNSTSDLLSHPSMAPPPDASPTKTSRLSILPFLSRARTKSVSSYTTDTDLDSLPPAHTYHGYTTDTDYNAQSSKNPVIHSTSTSLGSKLVAHLTPLKHRRSMRHPPSGERAKPSFDRSYSASKETLIPPTPTPRTPSSDSTLSSSRTGAATPQPTITVSHPPTERENLNEFSDLFFPPGVKKGTKKVSASVAAPANPQEQRQGQPTDKHSQPSPQITPRPAAQTPASKIAVRRKAEESFGRKSADEQRPVKSTSTEKWRSIFNTETLSMGAADTLRRTTKSMEQIAPPISNSSSEPLPSIKAKPSPSVPSCQPSSLKSSLPAKRSVRRRAQTLTAASAPPSSPLPPSPGQPPPTPTLSTASAPTSPSSFTFPSPQIPGDLFRDGYIDKESIENASPEKLREVLIAQIARFEQLAAYVTTVTDMHTAEKTMLEDRIEILEKEAKMREREVKGLRWMVMNGRGSPGGNASSAASIRSAPVNDTPNRLRNPSAYFSASVSGNSESESGFDSPSGLTPILRKKKPTGSQLSQTGQAPIYKRSSISSLASSGTATSNISNPGLTSIPESPTHTRSSHELTTPPSSDLESDKKKSDSFVVSTFPHRLSTSSNSSMSSGLQFSGRSRPSSIAQVLQQSSGGTTRKSKLQQQQQ